MRHPDSVRLSCALPLAPGRQLGRLEVHRGRGVVVVAAAPGDDHAGDGDRGDRGSSSERSPRTVPRPARTMATRRPGHLGGSRPSALGDDGGDDGVLEVVAGLGPHVGVAEQRHQLVEVGPRQIVDLDAFLTGEVGNAFVVVRHDIFPVTGYESRGSTVRLIPPLPQVPEPSGEVTMRTERPRLHRTHWHAQPLGDLGVGQLLEVLEADDLPLVGGQRVDRRPHLGDLVAALDADRQLDDRGVGGRHVVERCRRPARLAAVDVDRGPPGDRRQPWPQLAGRVEPGGGPPRLDEGLLRGLVGEVAGAERPEADGEDETAVGAEDRPHGVGIPAPEPGQVVGLHHGQRPYCDDPPAAPD